LEDRAARDLTVVRAVLAGDGQAYAEIVAQYQRLVASIAWRHGVSRAEVEDVVSEVFFKAYRQLHRFRPEHAFSSWLYRLAVNHVIDLRRRARKERGRSELPLQMADPSADTAGGVELDERAALLRGALEEVRDVYRQVLLLVYVEGLKVDQVAEALALPSGTVKTRLMRGREALRRILVRHHPEYFGAGT